MIEATPTPQVTPKRGPVATLGSLLVSIHVLQDDNLRSTRLSKRLVKIGLVGGLVSIAALILAGAVWAAGVDPTGACGGG